MNSAKTILFIMPRLPFPASSGRKTSLYHYCRILSSELGYRLVVAAFLERGDDPEKKPDFIDRLVILPKASAPSKMLTVLKESMLLRRKPLQVSLYWSAEAKKIVDNILAEEKPDIVIGDMIRTTEYIKDTAAFRIADLDDRISLRYERQLQVDIESVNPYGAFLTSVPKPIQKIMLLRPVKLFVVKTEIALLKKYELEISRRCDKTVFVAQTEADKLNEELGENKAVAVPIGVDTDYFSYRETGKDGNVIGFLGAMNVAHNENAVRYFADRILPEVLKEVPDARFQVIGGGVSEELGRLTDEHIQFTGRVEDVREYLGKCKVFVCPMTFGSGIKTKNLEAMAMGLPVVTTSIGAENIDAENGVDWIVSDEPEEFARAVVRLLLDQESGVRLGRSGSQYIGKNWTWDAAKEAFSSLLGCVL